MCAAGFFFLRDHRRTSPFSNLFKILLDFGTELLLFPNCFISECSVIFCILYRAPDNFLKQGVADASLEAKGVFLQNAEVFSLPSFTPVGFYKLQI